MRKKLEVVILDQNYCDFLRKFDSKVPYNFDRKNRRPFIGVLFEVNKCKYFAPLSSPKPKHLKMSNTIDFLKLAGGKLGAINFNNMLPVFDNNIIIINLSKKSKEKAENQYLDLLREQLYWMNRNSEKIYSKSSKLYYLYSNDKLPISIKKRCCDFKLLEDKCSEYNGVKL